MLLAAKTNKHMLRELRPNNDMFAGTRRKIEFFSDQFRLAFQQAETCWSAAPAIPYCWMLAPAKQGCQNLALTTVTVLVLACFKY